MLRLPGDPTQSQTWCHEQSKLLWHFQLERRWSCKPRDQKEWLFTSFMHWFVGITFPNHIDEKSYSVKSMISPIVQSFCTNFAFLFSFFFIHLFESFNYFPSSICFISTSFKSTSFISTNLNSTKYIRVGFRNSISASSFQRFHRSFSSWAKASNSNFANFCIFAFFLSVSFWSKMGNP